MNVGQPVAEYGSVEPRFATPSSSGEIPIPSYTESILASAFECAPVLAGARSSGRICSKKLGLLF